PRRSVHLQAVDGPDDVARLRARGGRRLERPRGARHQLPEMIPASSDRLRLSRQVYRLRVLGLVLGSSSVGRILYEPHAPAAAWWVLAVNTLVWPHLVYLRARASEDPHHVERVGLTIDSAFGGFWVALMHFNLLPSVLIVAMMSMDKIGW